MPPLDAQLALQRLLEEQFDELRQRNRGFSLRAFAARVKLSPGALSGILRGKRRVSKRLAVEIIDRLNLDPKRRDSALEAVKRPQR